MTTRYLLAAALIAAFTSGSPAQGSVPVRTQASDSQPPRLSEEAQEAALALADLDLFTLLDDGEAAAAALARVEILEPYLASAGPDAQVALHSIKQFALLGLGRMEEAAALSKRVLNENPRKTAAYAAHLVVADINEEPQDFIEAVELAGSTALSREERKAISEVFSVDIVGTFLRNLGETKDDAGRFRLAEALLAFGWDGGGEADTLDVYRKLALDGRLAQGNGAGAQVLARAIDTPMSLLELLVARKYDSLFESGEDRAQLFAAAVELEAARTGRDLNADADDAKARLRRIQHLRSVGDQAAVLALTEDYAADMSLVAETGEDAFWAVNERAYSLLNLGRYDEAVAVMEKLLSLDMATYPDLISMSINHAGILNMTGRSADALAHAVRLDETAGEYTSPYGDMWIWSSAACALAAQGRDAEAEPWVKKIRAKRDDNMAALTRTLVCLNRLDEAEAVIIERLSAKDPLEMLMVLQSYRDDGSSPATEFGRSMSARKDELIARPAIVEAAEKVGRILALPIVQSYWGSY